MSFNQRFAQNPAEILKLLLDWSVLDLFRWHLPTDSPVMDPFPLLKYRRIIKLAGQFVHGQPTLLGTVSVAIIAVQFKKRLQGGIPLPRQDGSSAGKGKCKNALHRTPKT